MAEIHRLPDIDQIESQASEWIARLNADEVSEEDRARFEAWRHAHPRHARAYEELSVTWRRFIEAGKLVRAVAFGQALGASTQQAIRRSVPPGPWLGEGRVSRPPRRVRYFAAAAATLAALAVGIALLYWNQQPRTLFQTAIGEHASVGLPDGSSLELNSNSLARIDYTEQARVIRLEHGEAFFEVAHDTQRPFWVLAGDAWVRAVGTAFNVYVRESGGVRVTVSEGTVKVAASAPSNSEPPSDLQLAHVSVSVLKAGQQIDVKDHATQVTSLPPIKLTRASAWRSGTVYIESQPLSDVIAELARYTTLDIVVENAALGQLQVGGTFQANSQGAEALLTMLQDGFGLRIRREDNTAYIQDGK